MQHSPAFLNLPPELRNHIYCYVWDDDSGSEEPIASNQTSAIASALQLESTAFYRPALGAVDYSRCPKHDRSRLNLLLTCRQVRQEATAIALNNTFFHLNGTCALPDMFHHRASPLSASQVGAIKTITLTAKVARLRALNETWAGLPFGNPCLRLDQLIILPRKPDASRSCYAEVSDLSQCHTLAYVLAETLKGLKNVQCLKVSNHGCFTTIVWRLLYRSLVYRLWRWGGLQCGMKFTCSSVEDDSSGDQWFKVWLNEELEEGNEVGAEVCRLMGKEGVDPGLPEETGGL